MKTRTFQYLIFFAFALLTAYPFFHNLDALSLRMWDESRNAINAMEMLFNKSYFVPLFDGTPDMWNTKPPMMQWCMMVSMKVFGFNMFGVRFPSAMAGFGAVLFCFFFAKYKLKDQKAGVFAGLVLATSIGFIDYHAARNGDFDVMLVFFQFIFALSLFAYIIDRDKRWLLASALGLMFAILTKGIAALMIGPGILVYVLVFSDARKILADKKVYIYLGAAVILAGGYYLLREMLNPGYIKAVVQNELLGRYNQTSEDHSGKWTFYTENLRDHRYQAWLFWIPAALAITSFSKKELVKKLGWFCFLVLGLFLLVVSSAATKLPWYDMSFFPFAALLIGLALAEITEMIENAIVPNYGLTKARIALILLVIACFSVPFKYIIATSVRAEKENTYPELFYGDMIEEFYASHPLTTPLNVISAGYNSHLMFYVEKFKSLGCPIVVKQPSDAIPKDEFILICEPDMMNRFDQNQKAQVLSNDGPRFILKSSTSVSFDKPAATASQAAEMIQAKIGEINANAEWKKSIEEKAKASGVDVEVQKRNDAIYVLKEAQLLTDSLISSPSP